MRYPFRRQRVWAPQARNEPAIAAQGVEELGRSGVGVGSSRNRAYATGDADGRSRRYDRARLTMTAPIWMAPATRRFIRRHCLSSRPGPGVADGRSGGVGGR